MRQGLTRRLSGLLLMLSLGAGAPAQASEAQLSGEEQARYLAELKRLYLTKDERKALLALVIDWLAAWVADLARTAAGGEPQRNPDHAAALHALAPSVAPAALFRYHRSLQEQRALVAHPLAPRLVAETLLIRYRELFR